MNSISDGLLFKESIKSQLFKVNEDAAQLMERISFCHKFHFGKLENEID